jgi:hypothetical protein
MEVGGAINTTVFDVVSPPAQSRRAFIFLSILNTMSAKEVPLIPPNAPQAGEVFKHYKGDQYKVRDLALHSNDDEWMVVYEPLYPNPAANLFTRPLREWSEIVEWQGAQVERFSKISSL